MPKSCLHRHKNEKSLFTLENKIIVDTPTISFVMPSTFLALKLRETMQCFKFIFGNRLLYAVYRALIALWPSRHAFLITLMSHFPFSVSLKSIYKLRTKKIFKKNAAKDAENPFQINHVSLCPESRTLVVTNQSCAVVAFKFTTQEIQLEIRVSLTIILLTKTKSRPMLFIAT